MPVFDLATPLRTIMGASQSKMLAGALDLHTAGDLLRHYPRRYAQRGQLTDLAALRVNEHVTVMAEIKEVRSRKMQKRRGSIQDVLVTDGNAVLRLTFFNQPWLSKSLKVGQAGLFAGKVTAFKGVRQLTHPDYAIFGEGADEEYIREFTDELIPVYPATELAPSWEISKRVEKVLQWLRPLEDDDDVLPDTLVAKYGLLTLREAFEAVHRPKSRAEIAKGHERLRWEEAFVFQVALAQRRHALRLLPATPRRPKPDGILAGFDRRLPFQLTRGQVEVGEETLADLARDFPMHRLLQGEVGSGKTVCAIRAMLTVVDSGGQAALLAPTEVLAQQHYRSIRAMLGDLAEGGLLGGAEDGTLVRLLTGSQSAATRRRALLDAASGEAGIVVGTHALLEENVDFFDLGLVVIDEQHRFGVEQRDMLRAKAVNPPHVLVMTATPIPRTVAMTVFGDLAVSTLSEMPAGRIPISTHVVPAGEKPRFLERTWERVREEAEAGHQVYVVCPQIGEKEGAEDADALMPDDEPEEEADNPRGPVSAVLEMTPRLHDGVLNGLRVEMLHGRMPADEKDQTMLAFAAGHIDVLVATTVVEVGVDVPNATVMVVLDADRFGVSQLHQLRGRVGRGSSPGLCLLVTEAAPRAPARQRLDAVAATLDGFELAAIDLEQRREGDVLGSSQSGRRSSLRFLRVIRDEELIRTARDEATTLVERDPELRYEPALRAELAELMDEKRAEYLERG